MKRICMLLLCFLLVLPTAAVQAEEAIGTAEWKNDFVFINGVSIPAVTLPDGFSYLFMRDLESYGFSLRQAYETAEDGASRFVFRLSRNPYYPITEIRRIDEESVTIYETEQQQLFFDSETPAHIYKDQYNSILVQCDELAAYGSFHWDAEAGRIDLFIGDTEPLPQFMTFHELLGLTSMEEIRFGTIVFRGEPNPLCAEIAPEDLQAYLESHWSFGYELYTGPATPVAADDFYVNLWTSEEKYDGPDPHKITVSSYGSLIKYGVYGAVPDEATGVAYPHNYVYYRPMRGNGANALYTAADKLAKAYMEKTGPLSNADGEAFITRDLLNLDTASDWAKPEMQKAAAANLLPYRLASNFGAAISREDFCSLAGQLLLTRQNPSNRIFYYGDLDELINDELRDKVQSVSFTDMEYPGSEISVLAALGIINGRDDGSFDPEGSITREEAAAILGRMADHLGMEVSSDGFRYEDYDDIASWAQDAAGRMHALGVMQGMTETLFSPDSLYSKEQAIATMYRLYEALPIMY